MEREQLKRDPRVFALSDLHVDSQDNVLWLEGLSSTDYANDALILAGDVSDDLDKLKKTLLSLQAKFAQVFFVPGNHELWVRRGEAADSVAKFWQVLDLCDALGVRTRPARVGAGREGGGVWILPLFSWYVKPEEGPGSLFVPKEGEDPALTMWSDNYFTSWPALEAGRTVASYFLALNERHLRQPYDAPVISFSHFLPRTDLIFGSKEEYEAAGIEFKDPYPSFNFSRVAGCQELEAQIRRLGPVIHVYGHQHRNRQRVIDDLLYVSHCLGYPHEQEDGHVHGIGNGPKLIWDPLEPPRQ